MTDSRSHTLIEDAQGLVFGTAMTAFGLVVLTHLGLVTGQTAGLAVLLSYVTGYGFGPVFFLVNIPFYLLAWMRMGKVFTLKTFVAVALLSGMSMVMPGWMSFAHVNPLFGAVLFGLCAGAGLLALFRHGASLGGIGILALMLQERFGWRAGWVQLGFDAVLFLVALLVLRDPLVIALSFVAALVVNLVVAINHRRDRYIAT